MLDDVELISLEERRSERHGGYGAKMTARDFPRKKGATGGGGGQRRQGARPETLCGRSDALEMPVLPVNEGLSTSNYRLSFD
jgi:hypothetical protein